MKDGLVKFKVGESASTTFLVNEKLLHDFSEFSGDKNPIHLDCKEAQSFGYARQVAHGAISIAFVSYLIGMKIPGPGALWMNQQNEWLAPVFLGDQIEIVVKIAKISEATQVLFLEYQAVNQQGQKVMIGNASVRVSERVGEKKMVQTNEKKIVLVTGGARGIGAAAAMRFALEGHIVLINYKQSEVQAAKICQDIQQNGGEAHLYRADLADTEAVKSMIAQILTKFGKLDIVVHNATNSLLNKKITEHTYQDFDSYFRLYVGASLNLVQFLASSMKERKFGRFIFLGTSAILGVPPQGMAAYVSAKSALYGLVKSLAVELGPFGITANMVSPGLTVTDLTSHVSVRAKELEALKSPARRLATVDDAAEVVLFFSKESSGYINGVNLPVTGGPC